MFGIIQFSNLAQGPLVLDQTLEWKDFDGDLIFGHLPIHFSKSHFLNMGR
jgi:hypothetical protein